MLSKPIIISDFQKGVSRNVNAGFNDMRNVDIHSRQGNARINPKATKISSTTVTGLIKGFASSISTSTDFWAIDDAASCKVYKSDAGTASWSVVSGNSSSQIGNDIAYWKDHIFIGTTDRVDTYGKLSGTPAWFQNWLGNNGETNITLTSQTEYRPILAGQDDKLYIADGRYIHTVAETTGQTFDDGTAATFEITEQALDLPEGTTITSLQELGEYLVIGTNKETDTGQTQAAYIYFWDRVSSSFELPVRIKEDGIRAMVSTGQIVYVFTEGATVNIYAVNTASAQFLRKIETDGTVDGKDVRIYPNAAMWYRDKLYFGVRKTTTGGYPVGVYSYDPTTDVLVFENEISTGDTGDATSTNLGVGALFARTTTDFLIGWRDDSTYGIDLVADGGDKYTSYSAIIDTQVIPISTRDKTTIEELEIKLARELATDEGVRIQYRENKTDSWTTAWTFDHTTYGAVDGLLKYVEISVYSIQWRILLTTGSASTTTPELIYFRFQ